MQTETYTVIDYKEFEELVKMTYGIKEYSFVEVEDGRNDSVYRFGPDPKRVPPEEDPYGQQQLQEIASGKVPQYTNHLIFQDLVDRGVLQAGDYLVEVCW